MSLVYLLVWSLAVLARCTTETYAKDCDTNLTSLKGKITFPFWNSGPSNYPRYTCKWNIKLGKTSERRHVELQFTKFNLTAVMPECSGGDYIELFLGCKTSSSIGKFCGQTSLPIIYSSDHCIQIVLHTSVAFGASARSEFQAVYNQRLLSRAISQDYSNGCGRDLFVNAKQGNIFSPHWPQPYPRYVDCVWRVTTMSDLYVKLVFFDFDVRSTRACAEADFVEVKTGAGFTRGRSLTANKECGKKYPFVLTIHENSIFIQFKSDVVTGNRGFMAGFVVYNAGKSDPELDVLIILGVLFLIVFALVGKAFLQRLIKRRKLDRKCIFRCFRGHSKTERDSPIVLSRWAESDEPERRLSGPAQSDTAAAETGSKEELSPRSRASGKIVTFETATSRQKRGSAQQFDFEENKEEITFL